AIANYPSFYLAGSLLSADQDNAETTAALGNIQQHFFDWTPTFAWSVFVQLVQHHENKRARRAGLLFVLKHPAKHYADHESLRSIVQVVDIHNGDLFLLPIDTMLLCLWNTAANKVPDAKGSCPKPTFKRRFSTSSGCHPVLDAHANELD